MTQGVTPRSRIGHHQKSQRGERRLSGRHRIGSMIKVRLSLCVGLLLLLGCGSSLERGPQSKSELYRSMLAFIGDPAVTESDRLMCGRLLYRCDDQDLIPILVEYSGDERFYAQMPPASASGEGPSQSIPFTVGNFVTGLLCYVFETSTRSEYFLDNILDWKSWWESHKHLSLHEIRKEIRDWKHGN